MCAAALPLKGVGGRIAQAVACDPAPVQGGNKPVTGWGRCWVVGLCVGVAGQVMGQVPNDDCGGAIILTPSLLSGQCVSPTLPGYASLLSDSTDMAAPDFPYPLIPFTCSGYSSVATPAKDVWYKVQNTYGIRYELFTPDTCQIAIWAGNDCGALMPVECLTVASTTVLRDLCGGWPIEPFWIYLQISNAEITAGDARFDLCVTLPCPPDAWDNMQFDQSTPTVCFWYDVEETLPSSEVAGDGALLVTPNHGWAPYTILWYDGNTDFMRSGLAVGTYTFMLTDDTGCQVSGSSSLIADLTVGVGNEVESDNMWCMFEPASSLLTINYRGIDGVRNLRVIDANGRVIMTTLLRTMGTTISLPTIASGVYIVVLDDPKGIAQASIARFINP